MIHKPFPVKGLNIKIPIITPVKGRGFINQGSTLVEIQHHCRMAMGSSRVIS